MSAPVWRLATFASTRRHLARVARTLVTRAHDLDKDEISALRAAAYTLSIVLDALKAEKTSNLEARLEALEAKLAELEQPMAMGPRRV